MSERCERTDLLADQCACPQHRGDPEPAAPSLPPWAWPARYPGKCGDCQLPIEVGDPIAYDPDHHGEYVHKECRDGDW